MGREALWIALERSKGIGPVGLQEIQASLSALKLDVQDLLGLSENEIRTEFGFSERLCAGIAEAPAIAEEIEDDCVDMAQAGIRPVFIFESAYPAALKSRLGSAAPAMLYCLGNIRLLQQKSVAILGHGEPSPRGEMIAFKAARELAMHSIPVISGLSKGTGVIAHTSALEAAGSTVGILPCGMFTFSMSEKLQRLYDEDRFLIASPFYLKEDPTSFRAMERNRIICALASAVFITEANSPAEGGIFEAGKSAHKIGVPLFTTEYSEYPPSAAGNPVLISEYGAHAVRGRKDESGITPNMDQIIAKVRFTT